MAIYIDNIPYLVTQLKTVSLPKVGSDNKQGFGNLVFPFTTKVGDTIRIINNRENLLHDNSYKVYYYNLLYKGTIAGRRYNIKDVKERKLIYERITKETALKPHPPTLLNKTPNRNSYFEMSKYFEIYAFMTKKFTPQRKMTIFWDYFKSIWMSEQTAGYNKKYVLISADLFKNFKGSLRDCIDNPVFMLYYTLFKNFELIKDLNIDFVIYYKKSILKINPSLCDEKSYVIFKRELNKIYSHITDLSGLDENNINKQEQKEILKDNLMSRYNFTGDNKDEKIVTKLSDDKDKVVSNEKKKVEEVLTKKVNEQIDKNLNHIESLIPDTDTTTKEVTDYVQTKSEMELDTDKELIENMYSVMQKEKVPTKPTSTARDAMLRKKQEEVVVDGITIKELEKKRASKRILPVKDVSKSLKNINENTKEIRFTNMNKDYIENVYKDDIVKVFTSLNNKSSKFYVKSVEIKDTSTELNYKDTYRIVLEDDIHQRHTITVDIPKFLDNKFLYLGGNKKTIGRQNFLMPVVKTAPDTVQIVTNYNKMFIRRLGTKSISSVERMMKSISSNDEFLKYFVVGNVSSVNKSFITTIEYDEFSKVLTKFQTLDCVIYFSQKDAEDYCKSKKIQIPENKMFVGVYKKKNIFIDVNTQTTDDGLTICDIIVDALPEELKETFLRTRSTKKLIYNTVTIMAQAIPFFVLLIYWEGFSTVIKKMNVKYYFSKTYPKEVKPNESVIRFKDAYFVYEGDLANNLLINGIKVLDTENYTIEEYNTAEPYLDYFKKVYGKVAITNALYNAYDFTIDPITKEVLEDVNLPTDLVELCIYASNLLADQSYTIENSQTIARIRSLEVIPAILYNEISRAFIQYKNSAGKTKLSIPKDSVIKQLMALQTVEDYSTLNPVVELEKDRALSSKGYRGINVDRAYSEEKRSYDDSMVGIVSMNTSPDG